MSDTKYWDDVANALGREIGNATTWANLLGWIRDARRAAEVNAAPIPMRLTCPSCGELHLDVGEFATKPHHTHACQACGMVWRPAVVATVGVQFLPGFKNEP